LPGVGKVNVLGQQKPAIRIQIDPIKLASTGLSLEDVRNTITNASTNAPKGNIEVGPKGFTIYGNDQITTADAFNDVVLTFKNGAPVRVRDIGQAVDGPEDTKRGAWDNSGLRIIASFVNKQPGANVVETAKTVYET